MSDDRQNGAEMEGEWESDATMVLDDSDNESWASLGELEGRSQASTDFPGDVVPSTQSKEYGSHGIFASFTEAIIARDSEDSFVYIYDTHYESTGVAANIFRCRSHETCAVRVKIKAYKASHQRFELLYSGEHNVKRPLATRCRRGIAVIISDECNSLLLLGLGAGRVRNSLLFKYLKNDVMLPMVPGTRQLENRKAYIKGKFKGGWEFDNFASLVAWCSSRMCQSREVFERGDTEHLAHMSDLIVLDTFNYESTCDGVTVNTFGMILTSRAIFRNVLRTVKDQGAELVMSTDGTYRIHFGGWTLIDIGSVSFAFNGEDYVQRFRPWAYMFVRTESASGYERLFRSIIKYARIFFDIDVPVASSSIDHADCIATAIESVWPSSQILTCWPHLARKTREQKKRLVDKDFYVDVVFEQLRLLHAARSFKQFVSLARVVVLFWREGGEGSHADWFESTYLVRRWNRWSVNSSSIPGFLPSQQPIESHHAVIKTVITDFKKAPTVCALNSVIPRLLLFDTTNLASESCSHFTEASCLPVDEKNHLQEYPRGRRGSIPSHVYFNSTRFMLFEGRLATSPVSEDRVRVFKASLNGKLNSSSTTETLRFEYLSLQVVTAAAKLLAKVPKLQIIPVWKSAEIALVRAALRCTCKNYMPTGWVCSHVLATLSLCQKLDLEKGSTSMPSKGGPGRKKGAAATGDSKFYRLENVIKMFVATPRRPFMWPVVDEFDVRDDVGIHKEHRVGQVSAVRLNDDG